MRWSALAVALLALVAGGCGRRKAPPPSLPGESGPPATLAPGQAFRFTDHFRGSPAPSRLPRRIDGRGQYESKHSLQPTLSAAPPYVFRQKLSLPAGAVLRLAYGTSPASDPGEPPYSTRFTIRVRRAGRTTTLLSREAPPWRGGKGKNWTPITLDLPSGDLELELDAAFLPRGDRRLSEEKLTARALWVNPTVVVPRTPRRPNIVLLVLDAVRADHLSCYGYRRRTTPALDRLAARGVLFRDASAMATWTFPSVQGLLTGRRQDLTFGTEASNTFWSVPDTPPLTPPIAEPSLQGQLSRLGYRTFASTGGGYLGPSFGFDVGFDWFWSARKDSLAEQLARLKRELPEASADPFFLFLHTYEVHQYRISPPNPFPFSHRRYRGKLTTPKLTEDAVSGRIPNLAEADRQHLRDLYDGLLRDTDTQLGAFFQWLFAQPWGKDTIVAVIADHGESFGEHGQMGHQGAPYREQVRVPLILYRSDGTWRRRRVAEPVSLEDLAPTLLELAGGQVPEGMMGRSLVPLLHGASLPTQPMLSGNAEALMLREGPWWYLTWRGARPEELYDIRRDPGQLHNLAASAPGELARLRGELAQRAVRTSRGYHLVIAGRRDQPVTLTIASSTGFTYWDVPTARQKGEVTAPQAGTGSRRLEVRLPAGAESEVVLFEPAPRAEVSLTAQSGGAPVAPARFHLGADGRGPSALPIAFREKDAPSFEAARPPAPTSPDPWGLWLWLPPATSQASSLQPPSKAPLSEDARRQLKGLGYLK